MKKVYILSSLFVCLFFFLIYYLYYSKLCQVVKEDLYLLYVIDDANGLDREFWKIINVFKSAQRCLTFLFIKVILFFFCK